MKLISVILPVYNVAPYLASNISCNKGYEREKT